MSKREFARLLRIGHGRPLMYLHDHDSAPFIRAIEHACLTDQRFDKQCEVVRTHYLADLIRLSGQAAYLKQSIFGRLARLRPQSPSEQIICLALSFAKEGDDAAAGAIRKTIKKLADSKEFWNVDSVIELDGIKGLLTYVSSYLESRDKENHWLLRSWIIDLEERDGKENAWRDLLLAADDNPPFKAALQEVLTERESRSMSSKAQGRQRFPPYKELKPQISGKMPYSLYRLAKWGEQASEQDLNEAAVDLLNENDMRRQPLYFAIFRKRAFPLSPEPLLEYLDSSDDRVAGMAAAVLSHIRSPNVRAKALEISKGFRRYDVVVQLLLSNYEPGDYELLGRLADEKQEPDYYHWFVTDAVEFSKRNPSTEAIPVLRPMYDRCPCSICRHGLVKALIRLGTFPDDLRAECLFDCDESTRELARE